MPTFDEVLDSWRNSVAGDKSDWAESAYNAKYILAPQDKELAKLVLVALDAGWALAEYIDSRTENRRK